MTLRLRSRTIAERGMWRDRNLVKQAKRDPCHMRLPEGEGCVWEYGKATASQQHAVNPEPGLNQYQSVGESAVFRPGSSAP